MARPENEIPVAVPLNTVLARTDDIALALLGLQVYSTGLSVDLALRARVPPTGPQRDLGQFLFGPPHRTAGLLVGLEFADGRRITNTGPPFAGATDEDGFVFHPGGGSGGTLAADQSWWLSPLPPAGPLRIVVRCEPLGIAETSTVIDGTAIVQAAARVVELWPWEPAPEPPPPWEQPPDVPGDSWFSR
jgi:hypothetical protein